jgi:ankyrin repeat protein
VQVLLEHDADIYAASETSMLNPLHSAAFAGELELMKLLIRSTLDPETGIEKVKGGTEMFLNVGDANETTPLHLAALKGNVACVILLCESGAHVNVKDKVRPSI